MRYQKIIYQTLPSQSLACEMVDQLATLSEHCDARVIDKPVALYGAGNLGKMAKKYLNSINIDISCVIDLNIQHFKNDPFWHKTTLYHPDEVPSQIINHHLLAICIVKTPITAIQSQLIKQGWRDFVPFYDIAESNRHRHPLSNGWFLKTLSKSDLSQIKSVLKGWSDDISRAHHIQFLTWRKNRIECFFKYAPITWEDRFFIPQITSRLGPGERYLDVGAHHGDVIMQFMKCVQHQFSHIWAIEADHQNYAKLLQNCDALGANVTLKQQCLSNHVKTISFFPSIGYAAQISDFGTQKITTTTLDQLDIKPTFAKFHLEGWELDALKGGRNMLQKYRPMLAITIYHNDLGVWKIAKWLMTHLTDYHFILRHHCWQATSLVLYAIPKERKPF
ncbi:MAG: FkbM family methyltransferase [Pseudomonadota bacterium]